MQPPLRLVVERGDRYTVSVNGQELRAVPDAWWLDKSFNVYEIPAKAREVGREHDFNKGAAVFDPP